MARLNLKDKNANRTLLYLVFEKNKSRVRISTSISLPPKFWNPKTQQVRDNKDFLEGESINEQLRVLKKIALEAEDYFNSNGVDPTVEQLRDKYLELKIEPIRAQSTTHFWLYFDKFIEAQRSKTTNRSILDYDKALRKHLKNVEEWSGVTLSLNIFRERMGFVQKFEKYLFTEAKNSKGEKGFLPNSVGKQMKNLKVFLKWCFKNEYCQIFDLSHIIKHEVEVDHVYLSEEEIEKIYHLQLNDGNLKQFRDLFILGCETGLRWSDFRRIKPEHISENNINLFQNKTNSRISIPINSKVRAIISQYGGVLPNLKNEKLTEFNESIRGICKEAGIIGGVVIQEWKSGKLEEKFYKKHELVSSHTCRRSFCTNRFLAGIPQRVIMAISGHKTEKSFLKYLKLSNNQVIDVFRVKLMA